MTSRADRNVRKILRRKVRRMLTITSQLIFIPMDGSELVGERCTVRRLIVKTLVLLLPPAAVIVSIN